MPAQSVHDETRSSDKEHSLLTKVLDGAKETFHSLFQWDDYAIWRAITSLDEANKFIKLERQDVETTLTAGEFSFRDVDIKKQGIEELLPFKLLQGCIESVHVIVPFGKMNHQPVKVTVTGLYLVLEPKELGTHIRKTAAGVSPNAEPEEAGASPMPNKEGGGVLESIKVYFRKERGR